MSAAGASLKNMGEVDIAVYEGRLSDAAEILENGIRVDLQNNMTDLAVDKYVILAHIYMLQGKRAEAIGAAEKAHSSASQSKIFYSLGIVYLQLGEEEKALSLAEKLNQKVSADNKAYAELIKGYASLNKGDIPSALKFFVEAQRWADTWLCRFAMGRAFLEAEEYSEAASEFEICEKRQGEAMAIFLNDLPSFRYLDSLYYYIGRAKEGMGVPGASESFQKFLKIKENADPGIAEVEDAKKRLAGLKNQ
jgi:tetratricopeptide (TPR) repeat protein